MNTKGGTKRKSLGVRLTLIWMLPFVLLAQEYHPLIRPNTYWDVYYAAGGCDCYCFANRWSFGGDTVIGNNTYKKIYAYVIVPAIPPLFCEPFVVDTIPWLSSILMREDTLTRRVYVYDTNLNPPEYLQFDFSLQVGDTMFSDQVLGLTDYSVVTEVSTTPLENGELRKKIIFDYGYSVTESIGHECGFYGSYVCEGLWWWQFLHCVMEEDIHIYGTVCSPYVGISEPMISLFSIHPNPASDFITIETANQKQATILNLNGQELITQEVSDPKTQIDVSGLPSDIYLVKLVGKKGVQVGKFIKQ